MGMPTENQAIYFTARERAELKSEPLPALGERDVRVRATWTLISTGTETRYYGQCFEEQSGRKVKYPNRAGYCFAGVVEAVGKAVKRWKVGDHLVSADAHQQYVVTAEDNPASSAAYMR